MFDPGFKGRRVRGKEDVGTADAGSDPLGILDRYGSYQCFDTNPNFSGKREPLSMARQSKLTLVVPHAYAALYLLDLWLAHPHACCSA